MEQEKGWFGCRSFVIVSTGSRKQTVDDVDMYINPSTYFFFNNSGWYRMEGWYSSFHQVPRIAISFSVNLSHPFHHFDREATSTYHSFSDTLCVDRVVFELFCPLYEHLPCKSFD